MESEIALFLETAADRRARMAEMQADGVERTKAVEICNQEFFAGVPPRCRKQSDPLFVEELDDPEFAPSPEDCEHWLRPILLADGFLLR